MSLDQIMRQVNLGQAQFRVIIYALSLQTNGAMQSGILYERLIDDKLIQEDVKNVLKKVPLSVYVSIFSKELMSDLSIARAAYDLAVQTYFRFSEGFLVDKAEKWEDTYSTDAAFRGFGLNFIKHAHVSIDQILIENSQSMCAFTYLYLQKINQNQSFPIGL